MWGGRGPRIGCGMKDGRALTPERRTMDEKKTLADDLRAEEQRARRRFIHATRPRRPLTMDEARELCERIATA